MLAFDILFVLYAVLSTQQPAHQLCDNLRMKGLIIHAGYRYPAQVISQQFG